MRLCALTVLCSGLLVTSGTAQADDRWLIVPISSSADAEWMESAVTQARTALIEQGTDVWPLDEAAARFETESSAPATTLSEHELERWMSLSSAGVNDLAEGDYKKALEQLNVAQDLSRKAIEELNREPERARRVFDTCLYIVRATLATESESRARAVARECRRLVPRAEPSPYMHPPVVTDLLSQIDALQAKQTGELRVASSPPGCAARLNGVFLGETPVSIGDLFPGTYRVQVECVPAKRGRVHFVTVGAGRTERHVDARFDDSVASRSFVHLRYANAADEQAHRVADVLRIADGVGASAVVAVSMSAQDTMELELIEVAAGGSTAPAALARISTSRSGPSNSDLAQAAGALGNGRCVDFTSREPVALPCRRDEAIGAGGASALDGWPIGRRPRGQFIAGLTLVGVGFAGLVTGYALLIPRDAAGRDWVDWVDGIGGSPSSQQKWFDLGTGIIVSASVGAAALVTAMPLALPERHKTPWWGWLAGAGGVGLAVFSIAYGVTVEAEPATPCSIDGVNTSEVRTCFYRGEQISVAILTGLTAAPLITMPLVYLLRAAMVRISVCAVGFR
ncbi:MAG: PEGA domain-containing protein [Deltaproteobacteria bacterium]|nr:PEGA domain-containing protein [Deltaproteobacteria bacterium]